jgi:hypothetical protein
MTVQCCVCKKVRVENEWTRPACNTPEHASHTYCPTCLKVSLTAMRAELRRAEQAQVAVS